MPESWRVKANTQNITINQKQHILNDNFHRSMLSAAWVWDLPLAAELVWLWCEGSHQACASHSDKTFSLLYKMRKEGMALTWKGRKRKQSRSDRHRTDIRLGMLPLLSSSLYQTLTFMHGYFILYEGQCHLLWWFSSSSRTTHKGASCRGGWVNTSRSSCTDII